MSELSKLVRHWAASAALTSEQRSCLSVEQLNWIADELVSVLVENAALKSAIEFAEPWLPSCDDELLHRIKMAMQTPATDAFIAEQRAQGVEMFARHLRTNDNGASVCKMIALGADEFAAQLRNEVSHE